MEIKEVKIGDFIFTKNSNRKKFIIPDYQRPYVWDQDRVEDFWKDLTDNEVNLPFLGSFIFQAEEDEKNYDIVDGQQRIMTMSILLSVLRNLSKEISNTSLVHSIQSRITNIDNLGNEKDYFLKCWEDVQLFFEKNILAKDGDVSHSEKIYRNDTTKYNIKSNYNFLYEIIKEDIYVEDDKTKTAQNIDNVLNKLDDFSIVYIKVNNDEEAYTAFEIVNARGQELGNIDLLKNLFFKYATADGNKNLMVKKWDNIVKNIKECSGTKINLEAYLKHFWYSFFGKSKPVSSKNFYKAIKDLIVNHEFGENYDSFSDKMLENVLVYRTFFDLQDYDWVGSGNRNDRHNQQILRALKNIRGFNITQAYVLFLSLIRNKEKIGERKVRSLIKAIEKFHFCYSAISKLQGNKVEKLYGKYAEEFNEACNSSDNPDEYEQKINSIYNNVLNNLKKNWPTKSEFIEKFKTVEYKASNFNIIRYIFSELEIHMEGGDGELKIDFSSANIEHIQSQDLQNLKESEEFELSDYEKSIDNIGNLVILSVEKNSKAGNKPVDEKISVYETSPFMIVKDLVEKINKNDKKWTPEDIKKRADELAEKMYHVSFDIK
jgi:uncharacterized protein with ParB-like and HNH nuclease domain